MTTTRSTNARTLSRQRRMTGASSRAIATKQICAGGLAGAESRLSVRRRRVAARSGRLRATEALGRSLPAGRERMVIFGRFYRRDLEPVNLSVCAETPLGRKSARGISVGHFLPREFDGSTNHAPQIHL
jgi:hypothetical protein